MLAPVHFGRGKVRGFWCEIVKYIYWHKKKKLHCLWVNVNQDLRAPRETLRGKNHSEQGEMGKHTMQGFLFPFPAGSLRNHAYDIVLDLGSFQLQNP